MARDIQRLLVKLTLLSLPFFVLIALYVTLDPFKVIYRYPNYYTNNAEDRVGLNRDYVSTEILLQRYRDTKYDSFILGNSRSLAFRCDDWVNYIRPASPYHFDAFGESIFGIRGKLRLLDRLRIDLRHVLIVLDADTLSNTRDSEGHILIKHPLISGQSWFRFQAAFLDGYFSNFFVIKYLDYRLSSRLRPYMRDVLVSSVFIQDPVTNDLIFSANEEEIRKRGEDYFSGPNSSFYARDHTNPRHSASVVFPRQEEMLREIRAIFDRHRTDFQIVISPLYDQYGLNATDLAVLRVIFGDERVHDFSGVNNLTADPHNYYETSHYRPEVARAIMKQIYGPRRLRPVSY